MRTLFADHRHGLTVAGAAVGPAALVAAAGQDRRVPLSSCDGSPEPKPRGVDLLLPSHLGEMSPEQSVLAGPVTVIGKIVRKVRGDDSSIDDAALTTFAAPATAFDDASQHRDQPLTGELDADATVLASGGAILPVAIYT